MVNSRLMFLGFFVLLFCSCVNNKSKRILKEFLRNDNSVNVSFAEWKLNYYMKGINYVELEFNAQYNDSILELIIAQNKENDSIYMMHYIKHFNDSVYSYQISINSKRDTLYFIKHPKISFNDAYCIDSIDFIKGKEEFLKTYHN